jgi:hypothetical protein
MFVLEKKKIKNLASVYSKASLQEEEEIYFTSLIHNIITLFVMDIVIIFYFNMWVTGAKQSALVLS